MKSNAIASERVPAFYVRLKHRRVEKWYISNMQDAKSERQSFRHEDELTKFEIDQIGFFQNHLWFHFNNEVANGWIPNKFIRKNYRVLNLTQIEFDDTNSNEANALATLVHFSKPDYPVFEKIDPTVVNFTDKEYKTVLVNSVGSYKNITKKSFRRLRSQISRNRPVLIWGRRDNQCLVLFGFNHKVFFYYDPEDGLKKVITIKELTKLWKKSGYKAISY